MALLGKISAVLSANTQDFTRNLGTAKKELSDFAKRVRGIELNINTRALDGTLTKLQKFQRTVQEIASLQAKGIDLGIDPRKLEDQFRVFEDIGKPLTKLVGQIEGLSTNLQAGLYPALGEVQRGFQDVYRAIQNGEPLSNFTRKIDDLRGRLVSLGRVTAASADLGKLVQSLDADNVGASFAQPFAKSALQKSLELRAQAEKTPANARADGVFADLAAEAERGAVRIERAAARVFEIQLRIANGGPTTGRKEALASAQQQLNAFVRLQEGINRRLQTELRSAQIKEIISPQATAAADDLIKKLSSAVQTLRAVGGSSFEPLIAGAGRVAEQFVRGEASASRLAKAIGAINAASNSLGTGRGLLERTNSLLFSSTERERQRIQSNFDRQRANTSDPDRRQRIDRLRDAQLSRLTLNDEIIPELRALQGRAAELGSPELKKRADDLLASSRQISNALKSAEASAEKGSLKESNAAYERANRLLAEQGAAYRRLAKDIQVTNDARRQQDLFLQASGGRGEQLSQGARDAASDLSVARQFRGQIADGGARIAIQSEIERVTASVTGLQQKIAEVASSKLGAAEKIKELDRLDGEIRQSTAGLAEFVAKLSGGAFNTKQIEKAMAMARNTAGSISARSAQVAQLAFQQALFAIDDLFSATGGLEYRLRAVGNNITQLGLLLGQSGVIPGLSATTGLFIGLSTVLAGQAFSAITRWATGAEEADARTKQLNDALSRQKSLVESLVQAFESLGDAIARQAFSEPAQRAREFTKQLDEIRKKQKELRESRTAALDPDVQRERGRIGAAEKALENERDPGKRIALARELEDARRKERAAVVAAAAKGVENEAARNLGPVTDRARRRLDGPGGRGPAGQAAGLDLAVQNIERLAAELALLGIQGRPTGTIRPRDAIEAGRQAVAGVDATNAIAVRRLVEQRIEETARAGRGMGGVLGDPQVDLANEQLPALQRILEQLDAPVQQALDELSNSILESARPAAAAIDDAQKQIAEALKSGIPAAVLFRSRLDGIANELDKAFTELADITKRRQEGAISPDVAEREITAVKARIDAINRDKDAINARADALRRERTVDPQRQLDARIEAISANLNAAGLESGQFARRLREIQFQRDTIQSQINQTNPQDTLTLNILRAAQEALNAETLQIKAATSALTRFTEALDRATREAEANLQAAQQRADEARQRDLGRSTPGARDARQRAEIDLANQQAAKNQVDDAVARARARLEEQASNQPVDDARKRVADIQAGRAGLEARLEEARQRRDVAGRAAQAKQAFVDAAGRDIDAGGKDKEIRSELNKAYAELKRAAKELGVSSENEDEFFAAIEAAQREFADALGKSAVGLADLMKANEDLAAAVREAEASLVDEFKRLTEIDEALRSGALSAAEQSSLIDERRQIQNQIDQAVELDPSVRRARDRSTALEQQQQSSARGRQLTQTPAQRAAEELDQQIADIRQFASDAAEESTGLPEDVAKIRERMNEAINRVTEDSRRAVAPAVFALSDAVQNAVLQGPSRAALNAADVTTMEGSRELNRLLRGDDPARDVNLVELQKQTKALEEHTTLLEDIAKGFAGVAP